MASDGYKSGGRVAPLPRGKYSASESYKALDIVTNDGGVYMGKKVSSGISPSSDTNEEYWMLLMQSTSADEQDVQDAFDYVFDN